MENVIIFVVVGSYPNLVPWCEFVLGCADYWLCGVCALNVSTQQN